MGRMFLIEYIHAGDYKRITKKFCNMKAIAQYLFRKKVDKVIAVTPVQNKFKAEHRTDFIVSLLEDIKINSIVDWSKEQPKRIDRIERE